ncbi:uncharacterized protein LOC111010165 [Momordica charantia]|uniref:Uncharacterized protein LOC111010165 n=1 Tax=Momordica charantia TaxID=3673 RepID=A0A6J1CBM5_MOMCH|nr:uncharacterized protein LOC111010165 [Momordica charantia]
MASAYVSLKLLIDSKEQRVLFSEADKNVIDFLYNLLTLPLGTVIRLLKKQGMVGCLGNLYESVETLNDTYLQTYKSKDVLLKPKDSSFRSTLLLPNLDLDYLPAAATTTIYLCKSSANYADCRCSVSDSPNAICPTYKRYMSQVGTFVKPASASASASASATTQVVATGEDEGGFVKGVVTYMVMNDLTVKPMSTISSIALLNKLNVKEVGSLKEKVVTFGVDEGVKLLKASLHSKTVLTDVFMERKLTI